MTNNTNTVCNVCKKESEILNECDICNETKCETCDKDYMTCETCEDLHCGVCDMSCWIKDCHTCKHCYEYNQNKITSHIKNREYQGILNCLENYIYEDIYMNYILLECIYLLNFDIIDYILEYYIIRQDVIIDCINYFLNVQQNSNIYQIIKILCSKADEDILDGLLTLSERKNDLDLMEYLEYKITCY